MIEWVQFHNFKVLRDTTLPLSHFTLIVGPNGSGKSTAMQAFQVAANPGSFRHERIATAGASPDAVEVILRWGSSQAGAITRVHWNRHSHSRRHETSQGTELPADDREFLENKLVNGVRVYALDANAIAASATLSPKVEGVSIRGSCVRYKTPCIG